MGKSSSEYSIQVCDSKRVVMTLKGLRRAYARIGDHHDRSTGGTDVREAGAEKSVVFQDGKASSHFGSSIEKEVKLQKGRSHRVKSMLLFCSAVDMIGIAMIVPLLSPFLDSLGADSRTIGFMKSIYGAVQLISAPLIGAYSDRVSRRSVWVASLVGGGVAYSLLGITRALAIIAISRVFAGFFRQSQTVCKAWISELGTAESRSEDLGIFYVTVGSGFIVGPPVSGFLAEKYGHQAAFLTGSALLFVNAVAVWLLLPPGSQLVMKKESSESSRKRCTLATGVVKPQVLKLMALRFVIGCSVILSRNGLFALLTYRFGDTVGLANQGLIISLFAASGLISQAFIVGPLSRRASESSLASAASAVIGLSQIVLAFSTNIWFVALSLVFTAVGQAILKTAMGAALTKNSVGAFGEVLGVAGSIFSICRALGPLAAGVLVHSYGTEAPIIVASFCIFVVAILSAHWVNVPLSPRISSLKLD